MASDDKNGFDDLEASFFDAGDAGAFDWDEEEDEAAKAAEAERLKKEEEERLRKEEEERLQQEEAERLRREEEERLRREEAERLRREEEERLRREEAERLRREEEERLRREEAERVRREEEERLRREEAERLRREEEERLRREEAERLRREEAERLRREEEERARKEEAIANDWFQDDFGEFDDDEPAQAAQVAAPAAVAQQPVAEEPVAEEPVAEEPVAEEPVAEEPVAEEPVAEEPAAEEPAAEEPAAEEPAAEEPAAEEPAVETPVFDEPSVEEPQDALAPTPAQEPTQAPTPVSSPELPAGFEAVPAVRAGKPISAAKTLVAPIEDLRRMASEDDEDEEEVFDEEEEFFATAEDLFVDEEEAEDAPEDAVAEAAGAVAQAPAAPAPPEPDVEQLPADAPLALAPLEIEGDWTAIVRVLIAEAQHGDGAARAEALAEAARIHRTRIYDLEAAEGLARQAVEADPSNLAAYRELVAALQRAQKLGELREALVARAELETDDAVASELLRDAAAAAEFLGDGKGAMALFRAASERNDQDYLPLQQLRRLQHSSGDWEGVVGTLARMAALAAGPIAARLHYERGYVFSEQLERPAAAIEAFRESLEASAEHSPAFLALERLYTQAAEWSALAQLYLDEADRRGGADARFWRARAARIYRGRLFDEERAEAAYEAALEGGAAPELFHEYEAFLAETARWDQVAATLQREADETSPAGRPFVLFRLARVRELYLEDADGALAAYREVAKDPSAAPAAEAVARILQSRGAFDELLAFWQERIDLLEDPNLKVTLEYRMGEICEGPLGDQEGARQHFEQILDVAPGYLPALEGLERVYTRLQSWDRLAAVYEQRAILNEEPSAIALQLHRAGSVCEFRMGDVERARDFYRRALDHVPDFPPSLDATLRLLELDNDWVSLAGTLRAAAVATQDPSEQVSLYYRAARVFADKVDEHAAAVECLQQCLDLSPGFLSAHYLLKELTAAGSDWETLLELQRAEARASEDGGRKAWQLLMAAELATQVSGGDPASLAREVLEQDPENAGALSMLEQHEVASGGNRALVELYRHEASASTSDADRARLSALISDLLRDMGDSIGAAEAAGEVLAATDVADRPLVALARLLEGLQYWDQAQRALSEAGERFDAARLMETHLDGVEEAGAIYKEMLADEPDSLMALDALARVQRSMHDAEGRAAAHLALAKAVGEGALISVHATVAGYLFGRLGREDAAIESYRLAFDARPASGKAFEELRRLLVGRKDVDGLKELFGALPEPDPVGLAEALEEAGDLSAAAEVLPEAGESLAQLLRREHALEGLAQWREAFDVLRKRVALLQDPQERANAEARQRSMLAEHLAETDEAWDLYRQLHEDHPDDTEVLEALARIAGARGEVELGVQYLERLASASASPEDSARFSRRLAEIHERRGDKASAREAYLSALAHVSDDREALVGLQRLAEAQEDWQSLVGVLARQAALEEDEERARLYVRIAEIWQDKLGDSAVAGDAWRQVLELSPDNGDALRRLVGLSEQSSDWSSFVEHGEALIRQLEGVEKSALQRKVGLALQHHLRDEEGALRHLDAATSGDAPDFAAAQALETLRSGRGEWDGVVQALRRQAKASEDGEQAANLLVRAARLKLDTLQKRDDAAALYAEVLERVPDHDGALRFLADHRFKNDDHEGALELFAQLEQREGEWDLDDFDERVEIALFFFNYARSLVALGRHTEARTKLEKALELNSTHLPSLRLMGPILVGNKEWEAAEGVYRQVLQLTGGTGNADALAETYTSLGQVEKELGKLEKARKRFTKALELRPNHVPALQGVASVLFARGEWSNVLNYFNNIIYHAKEPEDVVDAYLTKGFVLDAHMNLPDKAAQHYQKTLAYDPNQPEALMRLAELSLRRRDWSEAASLAERALGLELSDARMKAQVQVVYAIALRASGDNGGASRAFEDACAADEGMLESMGGQGIEGYEQVHEILKSQLRASR